jgi:ribosomal protein L21E
MLKRKKVREKGKLKLSKYFQELKEGDRVTVVRELSQAGWFPKTLQGRTGVVLSKRGDSYIVNIKLGKVKSYIVHPIHLKKLESKIK